MHTTSKYHVRNFTCILFITTTIIFGSFFLVCSQQDSGTSSGAADEISVFIAGDAIITQDWSHFEEPEFLQLIDEIRVADVSIVNLEMLINDFQGYPQKASGGTWMSCKKEIADELVWAGFDMVGHANNHTFDFGSVGALETWKHVQNAGMVIAGSGKDLQTARAPGYFKSPQGTVALISNSSTYTDYGTAGRRRPDMQGRPGLNPLELRTETTATITQATAEKIQRLAEQEGIPRVSVSRGRLNFMGQRFTIGENNEYSTSRGLNPDDAEANLASIREAENNADIVVLSVHAHSQGEWLVEFCHQAVDAGADIIFGHGPHRILGIEIYKGKPIFYSLGDFVFQNEQVDHLPSEYYEQYGLGDDAKPEDAHNIRYNNGTTGFPATRTAWEGIAATIDFKDGAVTDIRLFPVDMGFGKPVPIRGRPKYADSELGKYIIEYTMEQSLRYNTEIEYVASDNIGRVVIK
ncbi:CapA family protein [candidate division KSB1 bacterium]